MNIRLAMPEDAARIAELVRSFEALLVEDACAAAPFWESMSQRAHEENIASERFTYYVAESEGVVVGFVAMRDYTHLFNLFVDRASQGRGLGRILYRHAVGRIPAHACQQPVTVNASLNAVSVYQAFGFKPVGEAVRQHGIAFLPMSWDGWQSAG